MGVCWEIERKLEIFERNYYVRGMSGERIVERKKRKIIVRKKINRHELVPFCFVDRV